ncbi:GntR family transcriptional regulator [Fodinibius sp.]|uniref:GntR family transcriptional regulator n=1 Tax=Fodinibius sp. TaxID=1872440 RepID=UPI0035651BB4
MEDITQPIPKYYQIYKKLLKQIRSGEFQELDRFYSDTELVEKYDVSRGTIREAVKLLIQQGYIIREQGKGTFVTSPTIEQDSDKLMGFTELMVKHDIEPSAKVIEREVVDAPLDLKGLMDLDDESRMVRIVRIRYGNEEPLIIEQSYFVYELFQPIYDMDLESNSIYELLYKYTDTRLGEARQRITAVNAKKEEAKLLEVDAGAPLLLMKRLIQTKEGIYFQYSEDLYRSDRINFTTTTKPYENSHDNHGLPLELGDQSW